jgi:hypothetical protein
VISKATRELLGIEPGFEALERVVGNRVELVFVPPPHRRSLKGSLGAAARRRPSGDLRQQRERAWSRAARAKEGKGRG